MTRQRAFTGAPWEKKVGYCRAQRVGNQVFVTGTAPVAEDGTTAFPGDPYRQARRCFDIITKALNEVGAEPRHVVRTRMFVTDISHWEEFGRAHQEVFGDHPPCTTMVEVKALIDPDMLIEVEADGIIDEEQER